MIHGWSALGGLTMAGWEGELERWLVPFLERLGHKTRQRMCPLYVAGLIGPGDRKSVQPMADVLDLYAEPPDPQRPVICFDESPIQLIGEVRSPVPAGPGRLERYDYEYRRNGTVNLFIFLDVHCPWRAVKVTSQQTSRDFAEGMRDLV